MPTTNAMPYTMAAQGDYHSSGLDAAASSKDRREQGSKPLLASMCIVCTIVLIAFRAQLKHTSMLVVASMLPLLSPLREPPASAAFATECAWRLSTPASVCIANNEKESTNFDTVVPNFERRCIRRAHVHVCSSSNATRALLVGPLVTRPGLWHSIGVDYSAIVHAGDAIVAVTSDAVDATSGKPIPYPPLHLHHIHISMGTSVHWHETHGDYLLEHDGYHRHMPAGFCERTDSADMPRFLTTQINDVRYTVDSAMSFDTSSKGAGGASALAEAQRDELGISFYLRLVFHLEPTPTRASATASVAQAAAVATSQRSDVRPRAPCRAVTKFILWSALARFARALAPPAPHPPLSPRRSSCQPGTRSLPRRARTC